MVFHNGHNRNGARIQGLPLSLISETLPPPSSTRWSTKITLHSGRDLLFYKQARGIMRPKVEGGGEKCTSRFTELLTLELCRIVTNSHEMSRVNCLFSFFGTRGGILGGTETKTIKSKVQSVGKAVFRAAFLVLASSVFESRRTSKNKGLKQLVPIPFPRCLSTFYFKVNITAGNFSRLILLAHVCSPLLFSFLAKPENGTRSRIRRFMSPCRESCAVGPYIGIEL